jgi:tRNA(fMet)-specific endonuclease VapC
MSLYILDTDHLSLYRYGHPEVSAHVEATPADQLAVTIITIEEQLRAWYTQVRRARDPDGLARAYQGYLRWRRLHDTSECCHSRPALLSVTLI